MRIRSRVLALLAASALLAAACGGNGGDSQGAQATTPPQPAKVTITASASGQQVKFQVPAQIRPGATELTLVNNLKEPAEFQLVRLDQGHTVAEFLPLLEQEGAPTPAWLHAAGGVGQAPPGGRRSTVVNLEVGRYDFFSTGSAEQEGAQPQYKRGGLGSFEVTGAATGAQLPATTAQITAKELGATNYQFEISGLKPGPNQVTFVNSGGQLHHVVSAKLNQGATFAQAKQFFTSEDYKGQPPVDVQSFDAVAVVDSGGRQVDTFNLEAGTYVFACFITDRAGGPPHAIKANMIREVKVPQG
jgi:plastocyanin